MYILIAIQQDQWLIVLGFNDTSSLVDHFCRLPEKGRREIEELVEEMKETDRGERGTGIEIKTFPLYPYLL